ncbi:MAG: META domain-containing protein [Flavobacteriaceae bacterium]|nr:META domain-containing protein [Flavobacteriaceae bacterium]
MKLAVEVKSKNMFENSNRLYLIRMIRVLVMFIVLIMNPFSSYAQFYKSWVEEYPEFVEQNKGKWIVQTATNLSTISRPIEVGIDLQRKSIVGYGGCNPFQVNIISVKKKKGYYRIITGRDAYTENYCTENINRNENQMIHNLHHNKLKVVVNGDKMTIENRKKVVMTLGKQKENPLLNFMSRYYWKLIQLEGNSSIVYHSYFYFDFEKHMLVGDTGCGSFEIDFEISSALDELSFGEIRIGKQNCDHGIKADMSQCFVDLLNKGEFGFDVAEQTLNFYQDNRIIMMFGFIPKEY